MKKIDKAIMLLRSIPEDKLDIVIDYLDAFSRIPPKKASGPADIINISDKVPDSGRKN